MMIVGLAIALLALAGGLLLLLRRPAPRPRLPDDRDETELERAEREVRELGSGVTPDEADDQLDDWGPGSPR
jgi:hypothetical protein